MEVFSVAYYLVGLTDGYHPLKRHESTLSMECLWMLSRAVLKKFPEGRHSAYNLSRVRSSASSLH